MSGIFKAYDVRGLYITELDETAAYKIGYNLPKLLGAKDVLIGYDARKSSPSLFQALREGVIVSGANVLDLGLSTTPYVYFATKFFNVNASVQITASHNPKEYNGFKISTTNALPVGEDTGLLKLQEMCEREEVIRVDEDKEGVVKEVDCRKEYLEFLSGYLADFSSLKIAIDCSSGMSSIFVKDLYKTNNFHFLNAELDGSFSCHSPNPLDKGARGELSNFVKKEGCDLGVIFDGDADRVAFVDERGEFVQPDYIIGLVGLFYQERAKEDPGKVVVCDVRTSKSTLEFLEGLGYKTELWKVGHAFAKRKLREKNAVFGGELAAHYYFRDFNFCDSGILASLVVLNVLSQAKKKGENLSSLIKKIVKYYNSGEINFECSKKDEAIASILEKYKAKALKYYEFDGIRMDFGPWWFSLRKSNTEPFLRLVLEAEKEELFKEKLAEIESEVKKFC